jgi:hypothetical protein
MKLMSMSQKLGPRHLRHPLVGERDRYILAGRSAPLKRLYARLRRAFTYDAVVIAVALAEFVLNIGESICVVVNDEQYRLGHI